MDFGDCLIKAANKPSMAERVMDGAKRFAGTTKNQFMAQAPAVLGGLGASMAVNKGIQGLSNVLDGTGRKSDRYWEEFILKYPEYEGDEKAREFFEVLMESNPTMAKHPVMVKSFLGTTYDHADAINPDTVRTLSSTEKNIADRKDKENRMTEIINDSLQDAIKASGGSPQETSEAISRNLRSADTMSRLMEDRGYSARAVADSARNPVALDNHIQDHRQAAKQKAQEEGWW